MKDLMNPLTAESLYIGALKLTFANLLAHRPANVNIGADI